MLTKGKWVALSQNTLLRCQEAGCLALVTSRYGEGFLGRITYLGKYDFTLELLNGSAIIMGLNLGSFIMPLDELPEPKQAVVTSPLL